MDFLRGTREACGPDLRREKSWTSRIEFWLATAGLFTDSTVALRASSGSRQSPPTARAVPSSSSFPDYEHALKAVGREP